jgi:hypothetical protein
VMDRGWTSFPGRRLFQGNFGLVTDGGYGRAGQPVPEPLPARSPARSAGWLLVILKNRQADITPWAWAFQSLGAEFIQKTRSGSLQTPVATAGPDRPRAVAWRPFLATGTVGRPKSILRTRNSWESLARPRLCSRRSQGHPRLPGFD